MSVIPIPEALKSITSFVQRAEELSTREPIVSYYCNFYAAKLAIEAGAKDEDSQNYILSLLGGLEREKEKIGHNEAINNDVVGFAHVENFALKIFASADNEDRAGKASKKTAKSFMAASTFLEVLKVFGPIDESVQEKIRYGRFKAPTPGPPGGEPTASEQPPASASVSVPTFVDLDPLNQALQGSAPPPPTSNFDTYSPAPPSAPQLPSAHFPSIPSSAPATSQPPVQPFAPTYSAPPPSTIQSAATHTSTGIYERNCKFAISALQYDDVNTALEQLEKAIAVLKPYKK
ncbi:Vta1 like-domain-containing protein [Obelidium mucronatum]|nr:Vta1 like-domain-containing protein [Obelidium mucronatum]